MIVERLAHQLIENHLNFETSAIIGIQPRGILLAQRLVNIIEKTIQKQILYGQLDITFYRDDVSTTLHVPNLTDIPFDVSDKKIILIDDVLFTGRTIRCALDAVLDFGRPRKIELLTLIDRRYSRQLPIQADYVGMTIDSMITQKVKVSWKEQQQNDEVILIDTKKM